MTKKVGEKEIAVKEGINAPIKLNITDAALGKLEKKYAKVPDAGTKDGYEFIRAGLGELRTLRTGAGKHKATLKEEAIAYNKRVDTEYNRIVGVIAGMEDPLKKAKDAEDAKKEALKEEKRKAEETRKFKINELINEIREVAFKFADKSSDKIQKEIDAIKEMRITKDIFQEFKNAAEMARIDVKTRLETLHTSAVEREESDIARRLEEKRLAEERRKLEEDQAEEEKRLAAERKQFEEDQAKEAAAREEREKKEREEREKREASEAENRKEEEDKLEVEREKLRKERDDLAAAERIRLNAIEDAAEEERLNKEKEAQAIKDKAAEKADEELQLKKYNASLAAIELLVEDKKISKSVLDAIMDGGIPYVTFG